MPRRDSATKQADRTRKARKRRGQEKERRRVAKSDPGKRGR